MNSARIMIVEDNTTVAKDCCESLESLGYEVISIEASGEEAVAKAGAQQPDAVFMDIHLRDKMDGIEAAEQIYSRFAIPVIFLSAYSDRKLLERARMVGSFGYLVKPFEENELYATLETALYKARTEKEHKQMEARLLQSQKMGAIATLAGGIAHQFNNILTVVNGNIELLEMKFSGDEEFDGSARDIKYSVERMTRLTAQLLAYARGGKYQVKTVSLGDFIKKALPLIKLTLASGIIVKADRLSETFDIEADLTQLQMVLSAVLLNASEALNENGCIQISCHDTTITDVGELSQEFPELEPGDYVCLTISDNGMGMDEKTLKQIFEPFFTTKFFGRGLGMAAAYGIIKNHNGWIAVDSEPGQGTTVEIYLPAA